MKPSFKLFALRTAIGLAAFGSLGAQAADDAASSADRYPSRPITIVFPWMPGSADSVLRELAQKLTLRFGQPVVIESRPGASTIIGAALVAKAPADGYTLLYGSTTTYAINPATFDQLPYDPLKNFAPVSGVITSPFFVFTRPGLAAHNLADFLALAKAQPGTLSYATPGIGSVPHLSIERLSHRAGIKMIHVPYKGSSPMLADVMGNHVDFAFYTSAYDVVKDGRVRGLAVSGKTRLSSAPELPTVSEAGVEGFNATVWFGLAAPAGTPRPIVDKLSAAVADVLRDPAMKARYAAEGIELTPSSPDAFTDQIRRELPVWADAVRQAGVKVEVAP